MDIFDKTLTHLEQALDLRLERQGLLAGNVANAATPGYVPKDIDFRSALAQAESANNAGPATAHATEQLGTAPGFDGNRVDLDRAMVALAQNALQYDASAKVVQKKLAILSYVASDGNG